ncbi:MAG: 6-carboxytetrahydropterin synthase QueD [Dehalococcoidales bacterium]|nr:6-carboxytetrahydropterin synthase QueD [Dehalococcoidales bacterium]
MYKISVEQHFDAAHALRGYKGKCEALHGHRFNVVAKIEASGLNDIGLAYDFVELKARLAEIVERFDHTNLNDIPPFDKINPSSENIASTVYKKLKSRLAGEKVSLAAVEVWESPQTGVSYSPE